MFDLGYFAVEHLELMHGSHDDRFGRHWAGFNEQGDFQVRAPAPFAYAGS
jgi:hypothetical protein